MESSAISALQTEFLRFSFSDKDFLINCQEIMGSISLDTLLPTEIDLPHFSFSLEHSGRRVMLFDMDSFLESVFGGASESETKLALLVKVDGAIKKMLAEKIKQASAKKNGSVPTGKYVCSYLALRVGCAICKENIPHADLKLLPDFLYSSSVDRNGLLLVRFVGTRVQYLIDIKKLLQNMCFIQEKGVSV